MKSNPQLRKLLHRLVFLQFFFVPKFLQAQGTENAIAAGVIIALLAGGLILFLIVMPIIVAVVRKIKATEKEGSENPNQDAVTTRGEWQPQEKPELAGWLLKGCLTLIICLIAGAIIVSTMFA